jgi:hypothetical protein
LWTDFWQYFANADPTNSIPTSTSNLNTYVLKSFYFVLCELAMMLRSYLKPEVTLVARPFLFHGNCDDIEKQYGSALLATLKQDDGSQRYSMLPFDLLPLGRKELRITKHLSVGVAIGLSGIKRNTVFVGHTRLQVRWLGCLQLYWPSMTFTLDRRMAATSATVATQPSRPNG